MSICAFKVIDQRLLFLILEHCDISQNKIKAFSFYYSPWLEIFLFVKSTKWWYHRRHLLLYFLTLCWLRTTNSLILIEGGNFFMCYLQPDFAKLHLENCHHISCKICSIWAPEVINTNSIYSTLQFCCFISWEEF